MPSRRREPHSPCSGPRRRAPLDNLAVDRLALPGRFALFPCALAGALLVGCGSGDAATGPGQGEDRSERRGSAASESAGEATSAAIAVESGPPKRIFAKLFVVNIRAEPRHDAERLGYARAGAVIEAKTADPVLRDDGCPRGWFELSTGGFVCNGRDVIAFEGDRLPQARGIQPDLEADLPYKYGRVRRKTPLYRRPPNDEEAAQYEGYVIPGSASAQAAAAPAEGAPAPGAPASGGQTQATPAAATVAAAPASPAAPAPTSAPAAGGAAVAVAAAPATSETAEESEPPDPITLGTLLGEEGSVVHRFLVPGFILSLDRTFRAGSRRYYRTQNNGFVPYSRVGIRKGSEFEGVVLDEGGPALPLVFAVKRQVTGYERNDRGQLRPSRAAALSYHDRVFVVGEEQDGQRTYLRTAEGRHYREDDVTVIRAIPRPADVPEDAKWIDVNLTDQTLVAYEGDRPVYVTLISSGRIRRPGVPDLDHRTPPGVYRVRAKHITATMDGDSAVDGPYSIEDVPYVMYFHGAYALHSAFWHDRFGHTKSHGCVNMAPRDARFIFRWSGPEVRPGWHGAFPTEQNPATWVIVRGETPIG